jgi:protein TonB
MIPGRGRAEQVCPSPSPPSRMAAASTSELLRSSTRRDTRLFLPISTKGLLARLIEEVKRAGADLARDPGGFIRNALSVDIRDPKRRQLLYGGLAFAIAVYGSLLAVIFAVGWRNVFLPRTQNDRARISWVNSPRLGSPGAGLNEGTEDQGPARGNGGSGGGSGQQVPRPTSKGLIPPSAPILPIVAPNPPTIPTPSLTLPDNIVGPPTPAPPPNAQVGIPTGAEGPFSPGPGKGGNLGAGNGLGAGEGNGNGSKNGGGAGEGNNRRAGLPSGTGNGYPGEFVWGIDTKKPGYTPITWIHRPSPIITPEARAAKVSGTVILRATFKADGTITDIEIAAPVDFMTESAIQALEHSRFRPATFNGVPITVRRVPVKIEVSLEETRGRS